MYASVPNHAAFDLVVIAASQGGLAAYQRILAALPSAFPAAVVVSQHRAVRQRDVLGGLLARGTQLVVEPAQTGARPQPGALYVAPADRQLLLTPEGSFTLADPKEAWPLADPLLASAAAAAGARMIAVVVSGRLRDGAAGVQAVKRAGGRVLVQDQATAECFGMPGAAIATGCVDFVLPVEILGPALIALVMTPGAATWLRVPVPSWALLGTGPPEGGHLVS